MKPYAPQLLLAGLFALVSMGNASAMQAQPTPPSVATEMSGAAHARQASDNPWPSLASLPTTASGPLLAQNDRYWRDGRWHSHKEDLRKAKWRKEQARKEAERRRQWERQHAHDARPYHR